MLREKEKQTIKDDNSAIVPSFSFYPSWRAMPNKKRKNFIKILYLHAKNTGLGGSACLFLFAPSLTAPCEQDSDFMEIDKLDRYA